MMRTTYTVPRTTYPERVTLQLQKRNKTANINVKNCGLYTSINICYSHWDRRTYASDQFATVFFSFFFFAKATGRTMRPIWTNEGSKRVVPLKEVPFGGLNDVPLNFAGKIPQKLKFWGREKNIQAWTRKNSNPYNLKTT